MKNKVIWLVMVGIISAGILITILNAVFLAKRANREEAVLSAENTAMNTGSRVEEKVVLDETPPEQAEAGSRLSKNSEKDGEVISKDRVVMSPLETAAALPLEEDERLPDNQHMGRKSKAASTDEKGKSSYLARLEELDLQIQRIRSEETESTAYSLKTAAENELKLWDSELNQIYNDILSHLDEEEKKELVIQERLWMKTRDAKAVEAAKKSSGGSLESLEYTASLAESTRKRAYELISIYDQIKEFR